MFPAPPPAPMIPARVMVGRLQFVSMGKENITTELERIKELLPRYCYVAIDTEYPGTVHGVPAGGPCSPRRHATMRLSRQASMRSPFCRSCSPFAMRKETFLSLWMSMGFNFAHTLVHDVPSTDFVGKLAEVLAKVPQPLMWVVVGGAFDFAHMVKMLSGGQPLSKTHGEFMAQGICSELCAGGLRTVAAILGMSQLILLPPSLAGPKSHTACCIFNVMRLVVHGGASYDGLIDGIY
ncbi:hypothetical protein BDA96_05G215300 [Sorghum bicolor]|uniref:Uncharacterized protein n=1 Tax=Sorghum bicolor TaxID=4558 RepID=A0A921UGI2_SORBI|nr:hypothetical protein BDA96_05G215300 [Sorghum bicolor]